MNQNEYSEYSITVGTDAGYYGSQCSDEDGVKIAGSVAELIRNEFPGIEVKIDLYGKRVTGPNEETVFEITRWIEDHWTAAL